MTQIKDIETLFQATFTELLVRDRPLYNRILQQLGSRSLAIEQGTVDEDEYVKHWTNLGEVLAAMGQLGTAGPGFSLTELASKLRLPEPALGVRFWCDSCEGFTPTTIEANVESTLEDEGGYYWHTVECDNCGSPLATLRADEPGTYAIVKLHSQEQDRQPVPREAIGVSNGPT